MGEVLLREAISTDRRRGFCRRQQVRHFHQLVQQRSYHLGQEGPLIPSEYVWMHSTPPRPPHRQRPRELPRVSVQIGPFVSFVLLHAACAKRNRPSNFAEWLVRRKKLVRRRRWHPSAAQRRQRVVFAKRVAHLRARRSRCRGSGTVVPAASRPLPVPRLGGPNRRGEGVVRLTPRQRCDGLVQRDRDRSWQVTPNRD